MSILMSLVAMVKANPIAQAAIVAGPITTLTYMARSFPSKLWSGIKKVFTIEVEFLSDMADYQAIQQFLTRNVVFKPMARNFTYSAEEKWDSEADEWTTKHNGLAIGYGTHIGFYKRRLAIIGRYKEEATATEKFKEHTEVTFFARRKNIVLEFSEDVKRLAGTSDETFTHVPLYINSGSWWNRSGKLPLRGMDTVFTADNAAQRILAHLAAFNDKRAENHRLGLPHHTGVLLYGPPGTGKSSLIHALASALGRSIYYLNLGAVDSDQQLTDLVVTNRDWSRTILVLEDFDSTNAQTARSHGPMVGGLVSNGPDEEPKEKKPVTLSTMLNILDGLIAPDGLMTIATTNHPERLDEALKRPGRFDMVVELGLLGAQEYRAMAKLFGKEVEIANDFQPMSGAALRQKLLEAA